MPASFVPLRPAAAVLVVGLLLTVAALVLVPAPRGLYWGTVDVTLLEARGAGVNPYEGDPESLVFFAAAVQRQVTGGAGFAPMASTDARLYGRGIRSGASVTLPNSGSQWQPRYVSARLVVEAVDPDPEVAQASLDRTIAAVTDVVRQRQVVAGVQQGLMIQTTLNPPSPTVSYVQGNGKREQAATLLLGTLLSLTAALVLESRDRRRAVSRVPQSA